MGKRIDAIKRIQESTPQEVLAGYLWNFVVNSKDHFWKIKYYEYTAYFEYDNDNSAFMIDILYLGQEHSFMLIQPDYHSVLGVAPSILEWLEATYATCCPPEPVKPKRERGGRVANRQQVAQSLLDMRPKNTPKQAPQKAPSKGQRRPS